MIMAVSNELKNGIKILVEGNEEGFNIIYSQTYDFVYKRAKYIMKQEEDVLDLVQETYIQAYKGIKTIEDEEKIYGWLGTVVHNQGMKIFRKKKEVLVDEEAGGMFENIEAEDVDSKPEDSAQVRETAKIISELLEELPPLQKAAVIAYYYDNMKIDDIAKVFGCSSNTIKSRLNYAKKYLKESVEKHEKKNGYKLRGVAPFIMIIAFDGLFADTAYAADAVVMDSLYSEICGKIGGNLMGSGNKKVENAELTKASAAKTNGAGATAKGISLGAKIGMGVAALAVVAGIGVGIMMFGGEDTNKKDKQIEASSDVKDNEKDSNSGDNENQDTSNNGEEGTKNPGAEYGYYLRESDTDGNIYINAFGTIKVEDEVMGNIYDGCYIYVEDGKYGLKNISGKVIVEAGTYEEMNWLDSPGQFDVNIAQLHTQIKVKGANGYGLINVNGEEVIEAKYDSMENMECYELDETSYYRIVCQEGGNSVAYRNDGTKIFELQGEVINISSFEKNEQLYLRKNENGKVSQVVSTKTNEVLLDCEKDGIDNIFFMNYTAELTFANGIKELVVFDDDYTGYRAVTADFGDDFQILKTDEVIGCYKYFEEILYYYKDGKLDKTIENVEEAWVADGKIYYIIQTYNNDTYGYELWDYDGIVVDGKYTLHFDQLTDERFIFVSEGEAYKLFDLTKRAVVMSDIENFEKVEADSDRYSLKLLNGNLVTIWDENIMLEHKSDMLMDTVYSDNILWRNVDGTKYIVTDMTGNIVWEFDRELHTIDATHKLILDVSGSTRAYYDFNGKLVYEVEK